MPAIITDGLAVELIPGVAFEANDTLYPANWLEHAAPADLADAGAVAIVEPPQAPEGKTNRVTGLAVLDGVPTRTFVVEDAPPLPPEPVPPRVTNFQGRAVMRQFPMPDGRSLFSTVDADLRAAVEATKELAEFDPARVAADLNWQAWEQANDYDRDGAVTTMLAARYGIGGLQTDELFREAAKVRA